ncbi:MAG: inovirus Gp2 family protein [Lentisphaerae bacterium]|jgi:hypothetical protein|nr:inovirus Gp2 family protein [Lentisphaerota bacterium]
MAKQRKLTFEPDYNGYPINTDKEAGLACDTRILNAIERTLDAGLEASSKALVFRYDVRLPRTIEETSNEIFKSFQADFCKHLTRKGLKPRYVAVREGDSSPNPHYHVAMVLDGQKTQNPYGHLQKAGETLARKLDLPPDRNHGLIHACDRDYNGQPQPNSYMLTRDGENYDDAFHRLSYLAKVSTKPSDRVRELFVSKRPRKSK